MQGKKSNGRGIILFLNSTKQPSMSYSMPKIAVSCLVSLLFTMSAPVLAQGEQAALSIKAVPAGQTLPTAPNAQKITAAVICIPGLTQNASAYQALTDQMAPLGVMVRAVEVTGFANSIVDGKQETLDFNRTIEQVSNTAQEIKKENGGIPVFVLGESTGGLFAMMLAARFPTSIDGIICSAPTWKVNGMKKIAMYQILDMTVLRSRHKGMAVNAVFKRVTKDKTLRKHLANVETRRQRFTVVESMKFLMFTKKLPETANQITNVPVLFVQGMKDTISPPTETGALFKLLATPRKTLIVDADAEHLIYEEGQFSPSLLLSFREWMTKVSEGDPQLTPKGILLSKGYLQQKKFEAVGNVFAAAGVNPNDTIAQDNSQLAKKFSP